MNIAISQNIFSVQMLGKLIRKTLKLYTYINYSGNKNPNTMCDIPKDSEKWVESKYAESERLGIVPGTWFDKRVDVIINFFYDILYTVGFIWMRRTWWYNFHYVKHRPFQPSCCLTSLPQRGLPSSTKVLHLMIYFYSVITNNPWHISILVGLPLTASTNVSYM